MFSFFENCICNTLKDSFTSFLYKFQGASALCLCKRCEYKAVEELNFSFLFLSTYAKTAYQLLLTLVNLCCRNSLMHKSDASVTSSSLLRLSLNPFSSHLLFSILAYKNQNKMFFFFF